MRNAQARKQILYSFASKIQKPKHKFYFNKFKCKILLSQELERQMMDVKSDEEGGKVTFSCNVAGYRPEELKVDVEGDALVIKGLFLD